VLRLWRLLWIPASMRARRPLASLAPLPLHLHRSEPLAKLHCLALFRLLLPLLR
jgi:hypothetical protein